MGKRKTKEEYKIIKEDMIANYADTPTILLAEKYGMHYNAVMRLASDLGLKKSEIGREKSSRLRHSRQGKFQKEHPDRWANLDEGVQYRFKPGVDMIELIGEKRAAARREKINESRRKTVNTDKLRIKYGLKPLTKLPFSTRPKNTTTFIRRLRNKGYKVDDVRMIAYFDDNTTRCPVIETRKPGDKFYKYMKFVPAL